MFHKKAVRKIFAKFIGKHMCRRFFDKIYQQKTPVQIFFSVTHEKLYRINVISWFL